MDMSLNFLATVEKIETIILNHPLINSVDAGRELEFDVNKRNQFPRGFIRFTTGSIVGGQGSAWPVVSMEILFMDRLTTDRSNVIETLGAMHDVSLDVLATMNQQKLINLQDDVFYTPLVDYQDTQSAGWVVEVSVTIDRILECYPLP